MKNVEALISAMQSIKADARFGRNNDISKSKYESLTRAFGNYDWCLLRQGNILFAIKQDTWYYL